MSTKKQLSHIRDMVEDLINENNESSQVNFHKYLQSKSQEIVLGEECSDDMDDDKKDDDKDSDKKDDDKSDDKDSDKDADDEKVDEGLNQPTEGSMSTKIKGKINYKRGGKKTIEKHGNASKHLDDGIKGKTKFKNGGKQPAKTLEKTPKPSLFNDGRSFNLGTT